MRILYWMMIVLVAAALCDLAWAQEPNQTQTMSQGATGAKEAEQPLAPEDPAVSAILETKPATPDECIRAAKILSDLKRPDIAKQFLQKVIDAKLDQAAMAMLAERFGSATFFQLSARVDLHPESKQLAEEVLGALNAVLQDPRRVAQLIRQLQNPSAEKRARALSGLMEARGAAVAALIEAMADPARAAEHGGIRTALVAMGRQAADPLVGILAQADAKFQAQAIAVLGAMKTPQLQLFLFQPYFSEKSDATVRAAAEAASQKLTGSLPAKNQALRMLTENAKNYLDLRQSVPGAIEGKVEVWNWDQAERKCIVKTISADDAARNLATRLSRDAYLLDPQNTAVKSLYITALLEAAAYQKGRSKSLDEKEYPAVAEAKKFSPKAVEEALAYAISNEHPAAATAAAYILAQIGKPEELLYESSQPSPLVRALRNADRRVRIAAAWAIMSLRPQRPYAGASYLPETLAFFAALSGDRKAILAGGNVENLQRFSGTLSSAGLKAEIVTNGREALLLAASSPEVELALIDAGIDQPPMDLLIQQIRHDYRSADLRVGLSAREGFFDRAQHLSEQDHLCKAFARAHDDAAVRGQLEQLSTLRPQDFVGFEERQQQAAEALDMLAELAKAPGKIYDLRRVQNALLTAIRNPALSKKALAVLAKVASPEVQRALLETANRATLSLEIRLAAVDAFRQNTKDHGLLLTTAEIQRQYQLYNDNKNNDPKAQKILSLILDCLEAPTATK